MPLSENRYEEFPETLAQILQCEVASFRKTRAITADEIEDFEQKLALHG